MASSFNDFMTSPAQVVCDKCGWQGVDEDCVRVPNSFIECPKCRELVRLLVEDDPVIVGGASEQFSLVDWITQRMAASQAARVELLFCKETGLYLPETQKVS